MNEHPNVVNEQDLEWGEQSHGEKFGYRRKQLGSSPAGRSWVAASTRCRRDEERGPTTTTSPTRRLSTPWKARGCSGSTNGGVLSRGDYVALPVGEARAHQIINSSDKPLRYLCFSTMIEPDAMIYPDSNKIGLFAGSAPGGPKEKRTLRKVLRSDAEVGYYEGEE
jgi:hypothetical protein